MRPHRLRAGGNGATVSYRLNEAARVRFGVVRRPSGHRGKARRLRGTFTVASHAGANSFHFAGRLAGTRLRAGRYRLVATPATGQLIGRRRSVRLQILPKRSDRAAPRRIPQSPSGGTSTSATR